MSKYVLYFGESPISCREEITFFCVRMKSSADIYQIHLIMTLSNSSISLFRFVWIICRLVIVLDIEVTDNHCVRITIITFICISGYSMDFVVLVFGVEMFRTGIFFWWIFPLTCMQCLFYQFLFEIYFPGIKMAIPISQVLKQLCLFPSWIICLEQLFPSF